MGGPSDLCSDRASYVRWVLLDHVYTCTHSFCLPMGHWLASFVSSAAATRRSISRPDLGRQFQYQPSPGCRPALRNQCGVSDCCPENNKRKSCDPNWFIAHIFGLLFLVWLYNAVPAFCVARMSWWMSPSWPRGKGNGPKPMNCSGCSFSR